MFSEFREQVRNNFDALEQASSLFYVEINRDEVFEQYLNGFEDADERQGHNCNHCKSFIRQYAGIVGIIDNKRVSIWDNINLEGFEKSAKNLSDYIHSLPITDVFLTDTAKAGTVSNSPLSGPSEGKTWYHLNLAIPSKYVNPSVESKKSTARSMRNVLDRTLREVPLETTETILELIAQGSLYRGEEHKGILEELTKLQRAYASLPNDAATRSNYTWAISANVSSALARIRNTAIGTLLINLSEDMELDTAVKKFEAVVAPANYKRPKALITPKMVQRAKEQLEELGLKESLERRYANESDLNINDILFTDKTVTSDDFFEEMAKGAPINPKTLSKIEEVSIQDFLEKVVPNSKTIEVLASNTHLNNLVSIVTSKDKEVPSLFKWGNNFSWSYTGGIADSMKQRVKAAGGDVDGDLRFSIQWNENAEATGCDLDAHAHEPGGKHIYYSTYKGRSTTPTGGNLDVDIIDPGNKVAVENITWPDINKMEDGDYRFRVKNYNGGRNEGFTAQIEFDGEIYDFAVQGHVDGFTEVAIVNLSNGVFTLKKNYLNGISNVSSKECWGIHTNQWTKVQKLMLSPNHWGEQGTGNKHYFFLLENCVSNEAPRPFYNEFLKEDLKDHRKVFEVMGSKLKINPTMNQLSGLGFSETQRNALIVRVEGKFKRTLKINF